MENETTQPKAEALYKVVAEFIELEGAKFEAGALLKLPDEIAEPLLSGENIEFASPEETAAFDAEVAKAGDAANIVDNAVDAPKAGADVPAGAPVGTADVPAGGNLDEKTVDDAPKEQPKKPWLGNHVMPGSDSAGNGGALRESGLK